jgi:hypothetical protein
MAMRVKSTIIIPSKNYSDSKISNIPFLFET